MSDKKKKVDRRVRVLTVAEKKKIKHLYLDKKKSATEIRKVIGCAIYVMQKFLKEEGILRTPEELNELRGQAKLRQFSKAERKDIVKRYKGGVRVAQLRKDYDCCYTPILRVLLEEGIDVRGMKPNSVCVKKLYKKFEEQDNK